MALRPLRGAAATATATACHAGSPALVGELSSAAAAAATAAAAAADPVALASERPSVSQGEGIPDRATTAACAHTHTPQQQRSGSAGGASATRGRLFRAQKQVTDGGIRAQKWVTDGGSGQAHIRLEHAGLPAVAGCSRLVWRADTHQAGTCWPTGCSRL